MRITDYLLLLRRRFVLVALIVAGTTSAAIGVAYVKPPVYESTARLQLRTVAPASGLGDLLQNELRFVTSMPTEAQLLKSAPVAEAVKARVGLDHVETTKLIRQVEPIPLPDTDIMIVTVLWDDPAIAQELADAFVEVYADTRKEDAIREADLLLIAVRSQIEETQEEIREIDARIALVPESDQRFEILRGERDIILEKLGAQRTSESALLERRSLDVDVVKQIESASRPDASGPGIPRNAALGFLIGIPMALGVVLLLDSSDNTVKSKADVEEHTLAPVLGIVPRDPRWRDEREPRLVAAADPVSKPAEAYRMLGVNLAPKINGLTRILVTSPGSAEGKSVTAANLAVSFVEAGYRVGIVSVDFRRPRLHRYFAVRESPGLAEGLTGAVPTGRAVVQLSTNLVLVPSGNGSRHPHQLLREARFVSFLDKLSSFLSRNGKDGSRDGRSGRPALVILDAPAVLEAAEVSSLASLVDGIVLAIRGGRTTRDAAREAAEQIRKSGGNLLGCVLVDADPSAANGDRPSVFGNGLNGQGLNGRGAAAQAQSEVLEQAR